MLISTLFTSLALAASASAQSEPIYTGVVVGDTTRSVVLPPSYIRPTGIVRPGGYTFGTVVPMICHSVCWSKQAAYGCVDTSLYFAALVVIALIQTQPDSGQPADRQPVRTRSTSPKRFFPHRRPLVGAPGVVSRTAMRAGRVQSYIRMLELYGGERRRVDAVWAFCDSAWFCLFLDAELGIRLCLGDYHYIEFICS